MTSDEFKVVFSRKRIQGVLIGIALSAALALIVFWPSLNAVKPVPDEPVPVADDAFLGVPDDFMDKAAEAFQSYPESFSTAVRGIADQDNSLKDVRLWKAVPGEINPGPQQIGDCVSWGRENALYVAICTKALHNGVPPPRSPPFQPFAYGITRVQMGNNSPPCGSDGAYPSYAIEGFKQFGYVTYAEAEKYGFTYKGSLAKQWGCNGPPRDLITIGKSRAGGDAYPIRSVDEWRDAICNGYPVTVAIPWKPGRVYKSRDGRWCMAFDGGKRGGHQICSLGYDGSKGRPYWYLMNSHGANWPSANGSPIQHQQDEPRGGVWIEEQWARWIVDNGELWAISSVPGFEADELDLSIFDQLRK